MSRPIFVVGGARDGQEIVVAALLGMGVFMGDALRFKDDMSMIGWYDDLDISECNRQFLEGAQPQQFIEMLADVTDKRPSMWGAKAEGIAALIPIYRRLFPDAFYIWCARDTRQVIDSIVEDNLRLNIPFSVDGLYDWVHRQQQMLALFLPEDAIKVDFGYLVNTPQNVCKILGRVLYPEAAPAEHNAIAEQSLERVRTLGDLTTLYEREFEHVHGRRQAHIDHLPSTGGQDALLGDHADAGP